MAVVGHRHHRAILYPVMQRPGGKVTINWLAYTKIPPGSPPPEAWDTAADKQTCLDQYKGKLPLFGGMEKIRFRRVVRPGDELRLFMSIEKLSARGGWATGQATVDGDVTCEGRFLFAVA